MESNDSYTLANLWVRAIANAASTNSTVRSRKNTANGGQTVTVTALTTGVFTDAVNTDALVTGDVFNAQIVVGAGGSLTLSMISFSLQHASADLPIIGGSQGNTQSFNTTSYYPIGGLFTNRSTEANCQYTFRASSTLSNLRIHVRSNGIDSGASTFRTRVDLVNGNQSVSIGAGTTGTLEDSTNTDAISVASEVNFQGVTSATATVGTILITIVSMESASVGQQIVTSHVAGSVAPSADAYMASGGQMSITTTESDTEKTAVTAFTARNLLANIRLSTTSATTSFYIRRNELNSIVTVSTTAGATGLFEDVTNTVAVAAGDEYNFFYDFSGASGSITPGIVGFELAQSSSVTDAEIALAAQQRGQIHPLDVPVGVVAYR